MSAAGAEWVEACATEDIDLEDVIEVEVRGRRVAVYRSPEDTFHATDAVCTHEQADLADGLVMGDVIECPKHNGRFDYRTGAAVRIPCTVALHTYLVEVRDDRVYVQV